MKKNDPFNEGEKFEIIKPFIKKEKKLVAVSEESGVPYSTLKRWVAAYRKKGKEGLSKNIRKDKATYRSADEATIDYIKNLYFNNPDIKILDAHKKTQDFLINESGDINRTISYDTVYRIIKSLAPFIKTYDTVKSFTAKSSNEIFEFKSEELDIEIYDWSTDEKQKPYLNIIYDNYSGAIAAFNISFNIPDIDEVLFLLRAAILTEENNSCLVHGKPVELVVNDIKTQDKTRLESVKNLLNMEINFFSGDDNNKLHSLFDKLNNIILKNIEDNEPSKLNFFDFKNAIKEYIDNVYNFFRKELWEQNLETLEIIHKKQIMDSLLIPVKSKRIIQPMGVKFQNLVYRGEELKERVGDEVEIKFDSTNIQGIKIFVDDNFLCDAYCQQLLHTEISLYEIKMLQHYIFQENYDKTLTPAELSRQLVDILETNI